MTAIAILDNAIRQDAEGRYCLNDLHRAAIASGSATESQRPSNFLKSAAGFIAQAEIATGVAVSTASGRKGGTFASKLVVLRYAAWISDDFEVRVYSAFEALAQGEIARARALSARDDLRVEWRPMTDALIHARAEQGKAPPQWFHFANEADCINRIALGCSAAKFRAEHDIPKDAQIRDYLTPEQIKCVLALQRANAVYLDDGATFEDRKARLTDLYTRRYRDALIGESLRIAA